MAKLTIGRMAKLYGLHRSTLHEAVAKGRVTAGLDGKGQKVIDLSEMIRVYGEPGNASLQPQTLDPTLTPYTSPTPENTSLQIALQPLLEELQLLRSEIHDLRESLRLIEHKPEPHSKKDAQPPQASSTEPASWASLLETLNR